MIINLEPRIKRLERQARIKRRWDAVNKQIAEREQEAQKRLADWHRSQKKASYPDPYFTCSLQAIRYRYAKPRSRGGS